MPRLTFTRTATVLRSAVLLPVLVTSVALGAERLHPTSTPAGTLAPATFKITGTLARPLYPGAVVPLDLRLSNRHRWDLRIVRVSVAVTVDAAHERAGCSREAHFRQLPMSQGTYPLRLRARSTRTLRQLGVTRLPQVSMLDLPFDQHACRGATFRLRYAGRAARYDRPFAGSFTALPAPGARDARG